MNNYIPAFCSGVFLCILFLLSRQDLLYRRIPDQILFLSIVNGYLSMFLLQQSFAAIVLRTLAGSLFSVVILLITLVLEHLTGKECLGGGDIKLLFAVCLHLGLKRSLYALAAACILALLSLILKNNKDHTRAFPFAPAVTTGVVFVLFFL